MNDTRFQAATGGGVRLVQVDAGRAGQRLDNFLMGQLKGAPRSLVYKIVRSGQVRVNGGRARPDTRLGEGDQVRIPPVRLEEPQDRGRPAKGLLEAMAASIVFEDARLLAINKPSGVASHGGSGIGFGVIETLRALRPDEELELVHRLDRDTSGLLIVARTAEEIRETLEDAGVVVGPVNTVADVVRDEQFLTRDMIVPHTVPGVDDTVLGPGVVPVLADTPGTVRRGGAPEPGFDNHAVYGDLLGMDEARLSELADRGVI